MGANLAVMKEAFPPSTNWNPDRDVPDLSGKVVIVTGGNSGIGKETARHLLRKNAKVYIACRSKERAEEAMRELESDTGKAPIFLLCDLASLASVKKAAEDFKSQQRALHILFNTAGLLAPPLEQLTQDGYDMQFGTNVLGHALLTLLLVDQLEEGAKSSPDGKSRVVNMSSNGAYITNSEGIKFDSLRDGPSRRRLSRLDLYNQSKFGNYAFSCELAKRVAEKGIVSNALSPGGIQTRLSQNLPPITQTIFKWMTWPLAYAALTQLYVGADPQTANVTGAWFAPWTREVPFPGPQVVAKVGPELWVWIEEQCTPYLP